MPPDRSPAFQFYPKDFLSDINVSSMSLQERGAYITLLCFCWTNNGALPTDVARLATVCGTQPTVFAKVWPAVRECFTEQDGRYIHPRLEREREKQATYRERQSDKGARGAKARWHRHATGIAQASPGHDPGIPQAMPSDGSPISNLQSPISNAQPAVAIAAAADVRPMGVGGNRPLAGYSRLRIFAWMVDDITQMLGHFSESFDLDRYLLELDGSAGVLPAKLWPWLKELVSAEAARRGMRPDAVPAPVENKRIAGLIAGGEAFLRMQAERRARGEA